MRKLFVHPIPVVLLLLLLSVTVPSTSPVVEASAPSGFAAVTMNADGDGGQEGPCWLTCYNMGCPPGRHWATKEGDVNRWDQGDHTTLCFEKECGYPPRGKHAPCGLGLGEGMAELDEAVVQGRADQLGKILADNEAVVLSSERRAIQVWSACADDQLDAHLPLTSDLFDALVLAQDEDALE